MLENCNLLLTPANNVIGQIDVVAPVAGTGDDYLTVETSLNGVDWTLFSTSGGINPGSVPFTDNTNVGSFPPGSTVFVRFTQFNAADEVQDQEACGPLLIPIAELTGEICCGFAVKDDWDHEEYGYPGGGYGHTFHQCYPPGTGSTQ